MKYLPILLSLLFASPAFSVQYHNKSNECLFVAVSTKTGFSSTQIGFGRPSTSSYFVENNSFGLDVSYYSESSNVNYAYVTLNTYVWRQAIWQTAGVSYYKQTFTPSQASAIATSADNHISGTYTYPPGPTVDGNTFCAPPVCEIADSDGDGVCNSCDKAPGSPDPKHCIWNQKVGVDGLVQYMSIDGSGKCDGSSLSDFYNSTATGDGYWDVSREHSPINPPTCNGDDGTGKCKCSYPASITASLSPTEQTIDPSTDELKDKLDDSKTCSEARSACEAACLSHGGVDVNTCTTSGSSIYQKCKCKDEVQGDITNQSPIDSPTSGSTDSLGGTDTNSDGESDFYSSAKAAIKDSGIISGLAGIVANSNSIANDTNAIGQALNGLGDKLDSILGALNGTGEAGQATGSADLPGLPTYDSIVPEYALEMPLAQRVANFAAAGVPLLDTLRGTRINVSSSLSSLHYNFLGSDIACDFGKYADIFTMIGYFLFFCCCFQAYRILVD